MTITKIIKGPHRFGGFWWVIADCGGKVQHMSFRTEQQARTTAPGQDSVPPSLKPSAAAGGGVEKPMKKELIKISEFQRRRWGENGTPPCPQAIRNYIRNGQVPGEQIGKLWYVDWTAFSKSAGNDLVAMVLKGAA